MQIIKNKSPKNAYNYALSQLFSASLFKKLHDSSDEEGIKALLNDSGIYPSGEDWNLSKGLHFAYDYLKANYRCEYIYMNEIANQILLKYHNDNSATLLKEVHSNSSIADIVIVNGNTVAYEIKTELDSFDRLPTQLKSYQAIYDKVNVVTHEAAVKILKQKLNDSIGIIVLDGNGILTEVHKGSESSSFFDSEKAVLTLRQSELVSAYEKYVQKLPTMGTALIHSFCYKWYLTLDNIDAHIIFYEALKSRKPSAHQFDLIKQCSPIFKMLFLGKEFSKKYCISTMNILSTFD